MWRQELELDPLHRFRTTRFNPFPSRLTQGVFQSRRKDGFATSLFPTLARSVTSSPSYRGSSTTSGIGARCKVRAKLLTPLVTNATASELVMSADGSLFILIIISRT